MVEAVALQEVVVEVEEVAQEEIVVAVEEMLEQEEVEVRVPAVLMVEMEVISLRMAQEVPEQQLLEQEAPVAEQFFQP